MKKKILIVTANYYKNISLNLMKSAMNEIKNSYYIKTINVPGVFEIPVTISKNIRKYDGFIALGCVIKGQTPHFEFISKATTDHIMRISVDSKKPVGNCILTCFNYKQALERKNKGREAALALNSILYR